MSVGGGMSASDSSSWSNSSEDVFNQQVPFLTDLWSQGGQMAQNPMDPAVMDPLMQGYQQAFGAGNPYSTATMELMNPLISGLTDIVNRPTQSFAEGGVNPLLDKNVALALEQASTDLSRNLLPQIRSDAGAAGQYGGSRQNIAEGLALSDANRNALTAAMGAYGDQYSSDRAANLQAQAQQDQTALGAAQQIQNIMTGNTANLGAGMDMAGGFQNLQWNPLMNYANILGQPIVLGESASGAESSSFGMSGSAGM